MQVRELSAKEWPAVAAGFADQGFEQSLTYGLAAAERIGGQARFLAVEEEGTLIGAACLRLKAVPGLGRGIAWLPSGPLVQRKSAPPPDAAQLGDILSALRDQICAREGHVLRLRLPAQAFHDPDTITRAMAAAGFHRTDRARPYQSAAIDLGKDEAQLLAGLKGKWRTDLRYAQKSGLTLEQGDDSALQGRFMALFETVQSTKGFRTNITPEFHFALAGPDYRFDILIATKNSADLAGIVIGSAGDTATYLFGATAEAGRPLRAGYFLTWSGILLSRERGLAWYDLGGIDAVANPDVARFKERMNGMALRADPYEADGGGPGPVLIRGLESLRTRRQKS